MDDTPELPAAADSLEAIPEQFRPLYRQEGDVYVPSIKPAHGYGIDKVDSLKRQIAELGEKHSRGTSKLRAYEDAEGNLIEPERVQRLLELESRQAQQATQQKTQQEMAAEQFDALKTQLEQKHSKEMQAIQQRREHLEAELRRHVVTNAALNALSKAGANADLLMPHVESMTRVDEIDGQFVARVLDDDRKTHRISRKPGSTTPMDLEELVDILRDKFPAAYPAQQRAGSGTESLGAGPKVSQGKVVIPRDASFSEKKRMRQNAIEAGQPYDYE
tara:strand:- start:3906 stop:4730 length:825 start_codon:yes stop_codon:yes gene_type:complete